MQETRNKRPASRVYMIEKITDSAFFAASVLEKVLM